MNKGREFWVTPQNMRTALFLEPHRCALDSKPKGLDFIHVIEYQAYKKAIEALKAISSNKFPQGNGEVIAEGSASSLSHYAWVKLKELGEHE